MGTIVNELAELIQPKLSGQTNPGGRDLTKLVCGALKATRGVIKKQYGGPIVCRYSGCNEDADGRFTDDGHNYRVIEYLWDFSFSRCAITQAIEDPHAKPIDAGTFELLLVAECEMWTPTEVCRDLLKLLETRCELRCLVYKQYKRPQARMEFEERMIRVLHNHAHFKPSPGLWLFVGVVTDTGKLRCDFHTLNADLSGFVRIAVEDSDHKQSKEPGRR